MLKLSITSKISLGSILLILITAGVVGGIFYTKTTDIMVVRALKHIAEDVREAGITLQQMVNAHNEEVLFLANTPPFQGVIRARSGNGVDKQDTTHYVQWLTRMETIFESLLERKKKYLKIRFIDKNGNELVTVRRSSSGIMRLRGKQLQNKAHRPYVKKGLELLPGEVYISEIDLNREYRTVSLPYQEVLRIVTPVYDKRNNQLEGLVVLTVEIGQELRAIQRWARHNGADTIYITNEQGDYLLHPNPQKTYGFDLGKRYRIQEDIPQLAAQFLPGSSTQHVTLTPENTDGRNVVHFSKVPFDAMHPERFIAVIMTQDYSGIVTEVSKVLDDVTLWAVILVLLGAILAVLFSIRITRPMQQMTKAVNEFGQGHATITNLPVSRGDEVGVLARAFKLMVQQVKQSQARLKEINANLESMVEERTEDLNKSRLEAERANQAKSEFLSHMSHELRTPMNAILGFGQILKLDEEDLTDIQRSNVTGILNAGNHLLNLINEILDLSRIESGKLDILLENVNLTDVIQKSVTLMLPLLREKNIELLEHVSGNRYIVQANPVRLKQVFVNLLSNAVKYNRGNGKITINSEIVSEQCLRISITDTGKGLTEEEIKKLFTPFERLNVEKNVEGTGIGLVITKHLVELMGGQIGVKSNPGESCTFWVELVLIEQDIV